MLLAIAIGSCLKQADYKSPYIYPGYNEFGPRLYKSFKELAREAEEIIADIRKRTFPSTR